MVPDKKIFQIFSIHIAKNFVLIFRSSLLFANVQKEVKIAAGFNKFFGKQITVKTEKNTSIE